MTAPRRRSTPSPSALPADTIERLVTEAERGYDVDALISRRGRRGRPSLGSGPATVESVRIDPELKEQLVERAAADGIPVSEVIRAALRAHLRTG